MANEKRMIDANALLRGIDNWYNNSPFPHPGTTWRRGFEFAAELILKAPTVDAVEVVHGRWEYWAGGLPRCPVCGYEYTDYLECNNYCGNCGANMMDGDGNEDV